MNCLCTLEGKTAIVTGAAMGIGFGIAKRFADAGASVLLADIDETAAKAAAARLGARVHAITADIGNDAAPERIVDTCIVKVSVKS